jgi:hypothetical protein
VTLATHPHIVPRSIISTSATSPPPWCLRGGSGTALLFYFTLKTRIAEVVYRGGHGLFEEAISFMSWRAEEKAYIKKSVWTKEGEVTGGWRKLRN